MNLRTLLTAGYKNAQKDGLISAVVQKINDVTDQQQKLTGSFANYPRFMSPSYIGHCIWIIYI